MIATQMTKTQIDKLGDRLKIGPKEADLRLLDEYRTSFAEAFDYVLHVVRDELGLTTTGRRAKTTESIIAKLKRERSRLSQLQDIAGCRIIVADRGAQDAALNALGSRFQDSKVVDRRVKPTHGYRAVHAIVPSRSKQVEVQIRTALQHRWAEVSEKLADSIDPAVKYGGGPEWLRERLIRTSDLIAQVEQFENDPGYTERYGRLQDVLSRMIELGGQ